MKNSSGCILGGDAGCTWFGPLAEFGVIAVYGTPKRRRVNHGMCLPEFNDCARGRWSKRVVVNVVDDHSQVQTLTYFEESRLRRVCVHPMLERQACDRYALGLLTIGRRTCLMSRWDISSCRTSVGNAFSKI
jgi:hypothetical protein